MTPFERSNEKSKARGLSMIDIDISAGDIIKIKLLSALSDGSADMRMSAGDVSNLFSELRRGSEYEFCGCVRVNESPSDDTLSIKIIAAREPVRFDITTPPAPSAYIAVFKEGDVIPSYRTKLISEGTYNICLEEISGARVLRILTPDDGEPEREYAECEDEEREAPEPEVDELASEQMNNDDAADSEAINAPEVIPEAAALSESELSAACAEASELRERFDADSEVLACYKDDTKTAGFAAAEELSAKAREALDELEARIRTLVLARQSKNASEENEPVKEHWATRIDHV
ncbi:hypothetical protein FACS1894216_07850 [Synergistales bacterium]|nr:hypothetical protein FACS1894216_07850 [Synergistales bacterium]